MIKNTELRDRFSKVDGYINETKYELAEKELKDTIAMADVVDDNLELCEKLGGLYNIMERADSAIGLFKKVISVNPERQWSYHGLGDAYRKKCLYDEAISNYEKSLKISPHCIPSIFGIAVCLLDKGDSKRAIERFEEVIKVAPVTSEWRLRAMEYKKTLREYANGVTARKRLPVPSKTFHLSGRPHYCAISIVFRCNMKCQMCHIWKNKAVDEPPAGSWKKIIKDLSLFMDENRTINFAGGEPLLKDGLIDLIDYSRKNGFRPNICTNAWFIDEEMARRLIDSGVNIVAISLDSLNEKTHDYLRGVEGSYKRVMDAIEYLNRFNKDKNTKIHIQTIVSQINLGSLIDLAHWVNKDEAIQDITYLALVQPPNSKCDYQEWYKTEEFGMLWPQKKDRVNAVIDELIGLRRKDKIRCYKIGNQDFQLENFKEYFNSPVDFYRKKINCAVVDQAININTNGEVQFCPYLPQVGNSLNQKIEDVWNSISANLTREKMETCARKCHQILNCIQQFD